MPRIYINYKYNKRKDKFTLLDPSKVFVDLPVAELDLSMDIDLDNDEILVVPIDNKAVVVLKEEYLSVHKLVKIKIDGENVIEDPDGTPMYFPKDTDISKLKYIQGNIVMPEIIEKEE